MTWLRNVVPDRRKGGFSYSNTNYAILGVAISRLSGESYEAYLRKHVLRPLGIARIAPIVESRRTADSTADPEIAYSAGELEADMSDLLTWEADLMASRVHGVPFRLIEYTPVQSRYFAGFFRGRFGSRLVLMHDGVYSRYRSFVILVPSEGTVIGLLTNDDLMDTRDVAQDCLAAALLGRSM